MYVWTPLTVMQRLELMHDLIVARTFESTCVTEVSLRWVTSCVFHKLCIHTILYGMAEIGQKRYLIHHICVRRWGNYKKVWAQWKLEKQPAHQIPLWMTSEIAGVLAKCLPCSTDMDYFQFVYLETLDLIMCTTLFWNVSTENQRTSNMLCIRHSVLLSMSVRHNQFTQRVAPVSSSISRMKLTCGVSS